MDEAIALFERERARLTRLARGIVGTSGEAEDVVQSAWLRFAAADREAIASPEAWLTTTVSRLAIDALRSGRRIDYVGPWLPEPVVDEEPDLDLIDSALMVALERLTPLERAAFLLHDVFGTPFDEVARHLGRDPAAVRQLASRARQHVRQERPRFAVAERTHHDIAEAFFNASRSGDVAALAALLSEDAVLVSDGGGIRNAFLRPILGRERIVRMFAAQARKSAAAPRVRTALVDGLPGLVTREADGELQTTALKIVDGRIAAIIVMRNPQKLRHIAGALP
ncbi:RNA polymerase sigma factor SigJ [Acuticoccus sediminis]|uniref:RNA polymerase sigma factor SigJ n=1 Tax=Acuticoccus sediminis TaxID=2184697 RepID=UPI001CFF1FA8|nr:RNA polymerase sigma factor SigJ [Acuticoccus sediminis]